MADELRQKLRQNAVELVAPARAPDRASCGTTCVAIPGVTRSVFVSVLVAVICAVSAQYGLKHLIDIVAAGPAKDGRHLVGLRPAVLAGRGRQPAVARRRLGRRLYVRGGHRRHQARPVRASRPATRRAISPSACRARWPAASPRPSNAAFTTENTGSWNVLPPCVGVVCAIVFIGFVNLTMAGALVGVAAGLGALVFYLARRGTPLHRSFASKAAAVDGELVDVIGNMGVVRAFGATFREQKRIGATIGVEMGARRASLLYLERLRLIHAVITATLIAGVVAWGILLWQQGQATVGDLVLITALSFGILHCTRDLAVALVDLTQHVARLEEAIGSLLTEHELPDRPDARPLRPGAGEVTFEQVRFAYPGRAPVLREFDLTIEPGQRVGLVGYSGAGKSTVLALLQRFYDVEGGRILIDGQDIRDVTQESLRATMAIVPQDISLFHRTVLENIRYARPDAPEEDVLAAAEMANCREFIEALPDGFATMVGDRGVKLSGGQRQRLAIARALLKDAPILLLDEATSALDSESERAIQDALDRLMQGRTVIAIAHRLSTLKSFDRIIVMDHGRIVDDGPPGVLAARPGPYRDLLRKQQLVEPLPEAA